MFPDFRRNPSVETLSPTGTNEEEETSSELQHVLLALISIAQTPAAPLPPGCSPSGACSQIQALFPRRTVALSRLPAVLHAVLPRLCSSN